MKQFAHWHFKKKEKPKKQKRKTLKKSNEFMIIKEGPKHSKIIEDTTGDEGRSWEPDEMYLTVQDNKLNPLGLKSHSLPPM